MARFHKDKMQLTMMLNDWKVEGFTKGLNPKISISSIKLREHLTDFEAIIWADVHNNYKSKI